VTLTTPNRGAKPSSAGPPAPAAIKRLRPAPPLSEAPEHAQPGYDHDSRYRRMLAVADVVAATVAVLLAISIIGDDSLEPVGIALLPIVVLASKLLGLYDRDEVLLRKSTLEDVPLLFQLATLYTLLIWLLQDVTVRGYLSQVQVLGLWASLLVFAVACRWFARWVYARVTPIERCLLIGDRDAYGRVADKLTTDGLIHATLVGRVPLEDDAVVSGDEVLGTLSDLQLIIPAEGVNRVILTPPAADTDPMLDVIRTVKGLGVKVSLLPRVFEVVGSAVEFDDLGGMIVLGIRRFGLPRSSLRLKRATDFVGATLAAVLLAPLLAAIASAIKLDSRGPVLFRQTRVGKDGCCFGMFKFRTMVCEAETLKEHLRARNEADGLFKISDDPRVTRVGRFLRRTSLDELPQLINVLRGEMSLVGPRPLVIEEDETLTGWHRRRLHLAPGNTGHWQVLGSSRVPLHDMVKIDYLYVSNWSLWRDVKIMLRTVPYMVSRRGL